MSDEAGRELHDRATRGEYLTHEEWDALEVGYTEGDEAEMTKLREATAGSGAYTVRSAGLSAADRRVAAALKRRLADLGRPVDFRVFGSRALGNATWESDLDIFIELETGPVGANPLIRHIKTEGVPV